MELNYKKMGDSPQHLVILHGMFGMLDNWQTLARQWSAHFSVWIIDLRNHGKSPHSLDFDYYAMSDDLLLFFNTHSITSAFVLGHSMGGKVAMQFAVEHSQRVSRLIVADIAPKNYPSGGHEEVFNALLNTNLAHIASRSDAESQLGVYLSDQATLQFILKNLSRNTDGTYQWKFHLDAILLHYDDILANSLRQHDRFELPTLFIKGGESPRYIELPQDETLILQYFPNAQIISIPKAGHWLHADKPAEFSEIVLHFLLPPNNAPYPDSPSTPLSNEKAESRS